MILIDYHSRVPIYEQIKEQIIELIRAGVYQPDEQLPSIRALALQLQLNVNTVKRAFQDLEADGITYSMPGRGVYVKSGAANNQKVIESALRNTEPMIRSAKAKGVRQEQLVQLIQHIYEER